MRPLPQAMGKPSRALRRAHQTTVGRAQSPARPERAFVRVIRPMRWSYPPAGVQRAATCPHTNSSPCRVRDVARTMSAPRRQAPACLVDRVSEPRAGAGRRHDRPSQRCSPRRTDAQPRVAGRQPRARQCAWGGRRRGRALHMRSRVRRTSAGCRGLVSAPTRENPSRARVPPKSTEPEAAHERIISCVDLPRRSCPRIRIFRRQRRTCRGCRRRASCRRRARANGVR